MDHRWDRSLEEERATREERERFDARRIEEDRDVERRDRARAVERGRYASPWEIGAAHWNQRDLYTANSRVDDGGYGRGPRIHPEIGSYAYTREPPRRDARREDLHEVYAREAWPWRNYGFHDGEVPERPGVWERVKARVFGGRGPKNWRRADDRIHDDVCVELSRHGSVDASDIEVAVSNAEVTLTGTVPDRWTKRAAEEIAEQVSGVSDVHNRLTIRRDDHDDDVSFTMPIRVFS